MKKSITFKIYQNQYVVVLLTALTFDAKFMATCLHLESGESSVFYMSRDEYDLLPSTTFEEV